MSKIVVAAAQIRSTPDLDDNLRQALDAITLAAQRGARIVVLPEATSTSFAINPPREHSRSTDPLPVRSGRLPQLPESP